MLNYQRVTAETKPKRSPVSCSLRTWLLHSSPLDIEPVMWHAASSGAQPGGNFQWDSMWVKQCHFYHPQFGSVSKPWQLVNPKIAGKWMFIPLKMVLIGIDP